MGKLIAFVLFAALGLMVAGGYALNHWLNSPLHHSAEQQVYVVKPGTGLIHVTRDLANKNLLTYPRVLDMYARVVNKANIKVGEYAIDKGDTPKTLLAKLNRGDVLTYFVTLVEGRTFAEALHQMQQQEKLTIVLDDESKLKNFLDSLSLENDHPEGWFFPDTYQYVAGETDQDILRRAHQRMRDVLSTEWANRAGALPYKTPYEALIMASIVERETGVPSEREEIAGVFVRRLEKNMRLQTDPTVIYGLGSDYQGNIRRRHLTQATPYNTYVINGLPPTPIALPGREAIHAALHPAEGEALYFVAKGDGSHQFSTTLEEHNKAVREFQILKRAENYRSSPQIQQP